jgi:hypothetical protein
MSERLSQSPQEKNINYQEPIGGLFFSWSSGAVLSQPECGVDARLSILGHAMFPGSN